MEEAQTLLKFVHQVSKLEKKLLVPSSIHNYSILFLIIMKDEGPKVFKLGNIFVELFNALLTIIFTVIVNRDL